MDKFTRNTVFVILALTLLLVAMPFGNSDRKCYSTSANRSGEGISVHTCEVTPDFNSNVFCTFTFTNLFSYPVAYSTDFLKLDVRDKETGEALDSPGKMSLPSTKNIAFLGPGDSIRLIAYAFEVSRVDTHEAKLQVIFHPVSQQFLPASSKATYPNFRTFSKPLRSAILNFHISAKT
jgi:hypothetical protein